MSSWGPDDPKRPITWCVQCSLRAFVNGHAPTIFNTTMDEHMAQFHPDPFETRREREALEKKAREMMGFRFDEDR